MQALPHQTWQRDDRQEKIEHSNAIMLQARGSIFELGLESVIKIAIDETLFDEEKFMEDFNRMGEIRGTRHSIRHIHQPGTSSLTYQFLKEEAKVTAIEIRRAA